MQTISSILSTLFCLTLLGCTQNVEDVELPEHEPQLVAEAYITPDEYVEIFIDKTNKITDKPDEVGVSGANISIVGGGKELNDFTYFFDGYYKDTTGAPSAGQIYQLTINKKGFEPIKAKTRIPQPVQPQSAELIPNGKTSSSGLEQHLVKVNLNDRVAEKNYYVLKLESVGSNPSIPDLIPLKSDDPAMTIISEGKILFTDELFQNKSYTLSAYLDRRFDSSKLRKNVKANLRTASEDYFKYRRKLNLQNQNQSGFGPFNSEAVQIYSNVKNGYGVFAGYSEASVKLD